MNMKKRIIIIGIMICLLLAFIACKTEVSGDAVLEENLGTEEISEQITENVSEEVEEVYVSDFEPQVVLDENGITVTAKEYFFNERVMGSGEKRVEPMIKMEFVNNSAYSCEVQFHKLFVEGYEYDNPSIWWAYILEDGSVEFWYEEYFNVEPGTVEEIYVLFIQDTYFSDDLKDTMDIAIRFRVFELADEGTISHYTESVTFNTTVNEGIISLYQLSYDNLIFENEDVSLYLLCTTDSLVGTKSYFFAQSKIHDEVVPDNDCKCITLGEGYYMVGLWLQQVEEWKEQDSECKILVYDGLDFESEEGAVIPYMELRYLYEDDSYFSTGKEVFAEGSIVIKEEDIIEHD